MGLSWEILDVTLKFADLKNTVALSILIYWLWPAEGIESEPSTGEHNSKSSTVLMKCSNRYEELTKSSFKRTEKKVEIHKGMS